MHDDLLGLAPERVLQGSKADLLAPASTHQHDGGQGPTQPVGYTRDGNIRPLYDSIDVFTDKRPCCPAHAAIRRALRALCCQSRPTPTAGAGEARQRKLHQGFLWQSTYVCHSRPCHATRDEYLLTFTSKCHLASASLGPAIASQNCRGPAPESRQGDLLLAGDDSFLPLGPPFAA